MELTIENLRPIEADFSDEENALLLAGRDGWGDAEARVARGVAFLDRTMPGWENDVEVKELNLGDPCKCVLGQIFRPLSVEIAASIAWRPGVGDRIDAELERRLDAAGYDTEVLAEKIEDLNGYGLGVMTLPALMGSRGPDPDSWDGAAMLGFDVDNSRAVTHDDLTAVWRRVVTERTGREI